MKKESPISTFLGLTQQEMSMLLHVHPSQYSMFESGQRDLPASAMVRLAEMLKHVKACEEKNRKNSTPVQSQAQSQALARMLQENEYQSMHSGRQLAKASKKFEAQSRMLQLAAYIGQQYKNNEANVIGHLQSKAHKASKMLEAKAIALTKLQIKLELLAYEKQLLEQRLKV